MIAAPCAVGRVDQWGITADGLASAGAMRTRIEAEKNLAFGIGGAPEFIAGPPFRLVDPLTPAEIMRANRQDFVPAFDVVLVARDLPSKHENKEVVSTANAMHGLLGLRRPEHG
jgi:hypothetical protein